VLYPVLSGFILQVLSLRISSAGLLCRLCLREASAICRQILWLSVCCLCDSSCLTPHWQSSSVARSNLCRIAWHGHWPVPKWFSSDREWHGWLNLGCWIIGLFFLSHRHFFVIFATFWWWTKSEACQLSGRQ